MLGIRPWAAALLLGTFVSCAGPNSGGGGVGEWPVYRGDLTRDGHADATLGAGAASRLALEWRMKLGGAVDGSAIVAAGEVFAGSEGGDVVAVSSANGAIRWKKSGLGPVAGSPAVDSTTVYVATLSGEVVALSRSNGAIEWTWSPPGLQPAIWSTPTLYGGMVLVGIGSQSGDQPLEVGRIVALRDGREVWRLCARAGCAAGGGVWSTPAIDSSGRAFIGLGNPEDAVLAFNAATGTRLWQTTFYADAGRDLDIGATPVVYSLAGREEVGVGSVGGVFKVLDAATGAVIWSVDLVDGSAVHGLIASPAYDGKHLYVASSGAFTGLFALDPSTGSVQWTYPTPIAVYSAPAVGHDVVVFGEGNVFGDTGIGRVNALRADTGQLLWSFDAHAAVRSGPVIAGALVVVGDASGEMLAFRSKS